MYHVCVIDRWLVVGSGRCGLQLARHMVAAGISPIGICVVSRAGEIRVRTHLPGIRVLQCGERLPPANAVLLSVPDSAIAPVALQLQNTLPAPPKVAIHTSGLLPAKELAPLWNNHPQAASLHPLVSFPDAEGPLVELSGVLATIEGDPDAMSQARQLASALGMTPHSISTADKVRYHAAASVAANLTYMLIATAKEIMNQTGIPPDISTPGLRRLVQGAVENAFSAASFEKLTGPIVRGDDATVKAHLTILDAHQAEAYRAIVRLGVNRLLASVQIPRTVADKILAALTPIP